MLRQDGRTALRHLMLALDGGHVDVIIDMRVVGGEMAGDHTDFNRLVFPGHDALHTVFHKLLLETAGI